MDWLAIDLLREVAWELFLFWSLLMSLLDQLQLFKLLQKLQLLQTIVLLLLLWRLATHDILRAHCVKIARLFQRLIYLDVFHDPKGLLETCLRRACLRRTGNAGDDLLRCCETHGIINVDRGGERAGEVEKSATLVANERLACHVAKESCSQQHKVVLQKMFEWADSQLGWWRERQDKLQLKRKC